MKALRVMVLVALVAGFTFAFQPSVSAQQVPTFSCQSIAGFAPWTLTAGGSVGGFGIYAPGPYVFSAELGTATSGTFRLTDGVSTLAGPTAIPGTLSVDMTGISQPSGLFVVVDSADPARSAVSITLACGGGCDTLNYLPEQAVVGHFNENSEIYWTPGHTVNPMIYVEAGRTYYVAGQDETEQYYKVLISCEWVWVRKGTVGPNYDDVWQGKPLPTDIVE